MEHNYKYGEQIEIKANDGNWIPARFIGFAIGFSDKIIVEYGVPFFREVRYTDEYRPITKPKLVPWGPEDITPYMRLRYKDWSKADYEWNREIEVWASPINTTIHGVTMHFDGKDMWTSYGVLLESWETFDGKPCGKEVK